MYLNFAMEYGIIQPSKEIVPRPAATRRRGNGGEGLKPPKGQENEHTGQTRSVRVSQEVEVCTDKGKPGESRGRKAKGLPGSTPYPSP